jgi:hypothetical protein
MAQDSDLTPERYTWYRDELCTKLTTKERSAHAKAAKTQSAAAFLWGFFASLRLGVGNILSILARI